MRDADVGYTAVFDTGQDGYVVSQTTVTFAGSYCQGAQLSVSLHDGTQQIGSGGPVPIEGRTVVVPIDETRPLAHDVTDVGLGLAPRNGTTVKGARR